MNLRHHGHQSHGSLITAVVVALCLVGCGDRKTTSNPHSPVGVKTPAAEVMTDRWLGQWNGPEGTFLKIAGGQGQYEITVQNLDGPRVFKARAVGSQIEFERNGLKESIRATNGAETGMKWLSDKSNCLAVRAGEGYCRD